MTNRRKYLILIILALFLLGGCSARKKQPVIGVSQCSDDIWRTKLNEELSVGAHFYGMDIRIASAGDNSEMQMSQIRSFIREGVDLLIVSPNQAETIVPAVDEAFDAGIPVILFDRKVASDKYTAFIGADNVEIGRILGGYVAEVLGGKGRIVEIQGLQGSSPAIERHQGFVEAISAFPKLELASSRYGGWLQEGGRAAMEQVLADGVQFDAVFGQNDRMARGAYEALEGVDGIPFFGVDALTDGLHDVIDGVLTATYLYPTRGDLVMELASHILSGEPFERENHLASALVDAHNAQMLLMQEEEIALQRSKVEEVNARLDAFLTELDSQRLVLWLLTALIVLLVAGSALILRYYLISRKLARQLEESTAAKLAFFTNVSHDLRTPLTLVSGPLDRLMQQPLPPEQQKTLSMARRNVDVLSRLVDNILDFRKIESGKMPLRPSRFNLPAAVDEWLGGFREAAGQKVLVLDAAPEVEVDADMHLVERALFNLVSNAFKHTGPEGHITVTVGSEAGQAVLSIADDGEGIPPDKLPLIFDEFYQADARASGTGIGLALVRQIAILHGGDVKADSRQGGGSRFVFRIPLRQRGVSLEASSSAAMFTEQYYDAYTASDTRQQEAAARVTDEDRPSILVVDDNADIREYIASLIQDEFRVLSASDGAEALEKADRELPDLVICDVMMPVMDGLEFCRKLKGDMATSHIPVILLTAKSLDEQRAEGYGSGADAYIAKPFSEKVLLSRIDNLLMSRLQLKQHYLENGDTAAPGREKDFLSRFRKIVRSRLDDTQLNVEEIGREIGLSRVQLYRKVKALTGYSPVELVRITRLKAADELLRTTDKTVAEVAYAVGFGTPSYFTKCYKELFGHLPG